MKEQRTHIACLEGLVKTEVQAHKQANVALRLVNEDQTIDVPLAKNPSTGTAQQRLFLVLKVVLHAVVVISEVLRLSTKNRCSRCCRAHL